MIVSSRPPEGTPNHCPVCGNFVQIEPSLPFGDAPCPRCGQLLWFIVFHDEPRFFLPDEAEPVRKRVLEMVAQQLGVEKKKLRRNPTFVNDLGGDSLDMVELVMELEEEIE